MGRLFFASLADRLFLIGFGLTSANRLMYLQQGYRIEKIEPNSKIPGLP